MAELFTSFRRTDANSLGPHSLFHPFTMHHRVSRVRSFFGRRRRNSLTDSSSGDSSNNSHRSHSPSRSATFNAAKSRSSFEARERKASQGQAYRIAMADVKVLVYHYRAGNNPVVPNGLAVITHEELTEILADSTLRAVNFHMRLCS